MIYQNGECVLRLSSLPGRHIRKVRVKEEVHVWADFLLKWEKRKEKKESLKPLLVVLISSKESV